MVLRSFDGDDLINRHRIKIAHKYPQNGKPFVIVEGQHREFDNI